MKLVYGLLGVAASSASADFLASITEGNLHKLQASISDKLDQRLQDNVRSFARKNRALKRQVRDISKKIDWESYGTSVADCEFKIQQPWKTCQQCVAQTCTDYVKEHDCNSPLSAAAKSDGLTALFMDHLNEIEPSLDSAKIIMNIFKSLQIDATMDYRWNTGAPQKLSTQEFYDIARRNRRASQKLSCPNSKGSGNIDITVRSSNSVILQCAPASQGAPMPADLTSADELDYTTQTKSGPWVINTTSKYDHDIVTKKLQDGVEVLIQMVTDVDPENQDFQDAEDNAPSDMDLYDLSRVNPIPEGDYDQYSDPIDSDTRKSMQSERSFTNPGDIINLEFRPLPNDEPAALESNGRTIPLSQGGFAPGGCSGWRCQSSGGHNSGNVDQQQNWATDEYGNYADDAFDMSFDGEHENMLDQAVVNPVSQVGEATSDNKKNADCDAEPGLENPQPAYKPQPKKLMTPEDYEIDVLRPDLPDDKYCEHIGGCVIHVPFKKAAAAALKSTKKRREVAVDTCLAIQNHPAQTCRALGVDCGSCNAKISDMCADYSDARQAISEKISAARAIWEQYQTITGKEKHEITWLTALRSNADILYVQRAEYDAKTQQVNLVIKMGTSAEAGRLLRRRSAVQPFTITVDSEVTNDMDFDKFSEAVATQIAETMEF